MHRVMDAQSVKNGVMDAKIDPKVVMDSPNFKIGEWNDVTAQQSKFVGRIDDNEPRLETTLCELRSCWG